jgi:hypothetical protein
MAFQLFPLSVSEPLPCFSFPLRNGETELLVDLQELFQIAYDEGPYLRGAVDYDSPPVPSLPTEQMAWAQQCLQKAGVISAK